LNYDLIILGGGPGGYVAAIRAGQLGMKTALVEKEGIGGTCLNHGCIPSKTLLKSAEVLSIIQHAGEFGIEVGEVRADFSFIVNRSEKIIGRLQRGLMHLMQKNKVEVFAGLGRFLSPQEVEILGVGTEGSKKISSERIILSTGSRVRSLPAFPIDEKRILSSDGALKQTTLPPSIAIIGGGAVGVEFASLYATFGVKVTIIELAPFLLKMEDREVSALLKRSFEKRGITVTTAAKVDSVRDKGDRFLIQLAGGAELVEVDTILVAVGRTPNSSGMDLKRAGVVLEENTLAILVNDKMQTTQKGIWAIGDVTTRPALAHGAMAQGIYVVESIGGIEREPIDPLSIPNAIYCQPEIASVGLTEEQAKEKGIKVKIAKLPFSANPRALICNETDGFVKLISEEPYGSILGAHLIGPGATELISEFVLAKGLEARTLDIKRAIHPHPTLSEIAMEAGGAIFDQAIHF
jgi:dihydrolipoamide dehydrogenase